MKKVLDIGEVSRLTGVPPSTLRFYDELGLIRSTGRNGLRRVFNHRVVEKLDFIAMGKKAGFALDEISSMFDSGGKIQIDRKMLLLKVNEIERNIKVLVAIRNTIQHVANCAVSDHMACPKFQRLLRLSGINQSRERIKGSRKTRN